MTLLDYSLHARRPNRSVECGRSSATWASCVRGYCYLRTLGAAGLRAVSENAVLNANYLKSQARGRAAGAARRTVHARIRRVGQAG